MKCQSSSNSERTQHVLSSLGPSIFSSLPLSLTLFVLRVAFDDDGKSDLVREIRHVESKVLACPNGTKSSLRVGYSFCKENTTFQCAVSRSLLDKTKTHTSSSSSSSSSSFNSHHIIHAKFESSFMIILLFR